MPQVRQLQTSWQPKMLFIIRVAHTWPLVPCVPFSRDAYIAKCAMYAPPTPKRLCTQFLDTTLAAQNAVRLGFHLWYGCCCHEVL